MSKFERWVVLVHLLIESVEGCTTFRSQFVDGTSLLDEVYLLNALAEIALVDFFTKNGFIDVL